MNIVSSFSYTTETGIQAGRRQLAVTSVPVRTNPVTRESRLAQSTLQFVQYSLGTMVRVYTMYQPMRVFFSIGTVLILLGLIPMARFLYFFLQNGGPGHIQSLVLAGALLVIGSMSFSVGLVADLISFNRQLIEMTLERVRRLELRDKIDPDNPDHYWHDDKRRRTR